MTKSLAEERRIVSAQLPGEDARRLERLAAEGDRSLSAEVRRAIREHLNREENGGDANG